jgi:hypothetical protein
MLKLSDSRKFERFLEIVPGAIAWSILIFPFLLAPIAPVYVAYFILGFDLYWFLKSLNMMRHLLRGFFGMWRNMKIDWLERCKKVSKDPEKFLIELGKIYEKSKDKRDYLDYEELRNLQGHYDLIQNWEEIFQVVFITNYKEDFEITQPSYQAVLDSNFPNDRIITVACGEERDKDGFEVVKKKIKAEFSGKFKEMLFYCHEDLPGEVKGKGPNLTSAGHKFYAWLEKEHPEIKPENILLTTLDADHVVHHEYFSRLTYKYIIDPNRAHKTYQPVPLLTNNIWDTPAPNRITAVGSSFWQIVESMRPYRLRTFASHTQSLSTLLATDFWSTKTVVEDGHQYWRTYFVFNGEHYMVPLLIPVYQDCVLAETYWLTFKNQYLQRKRWAWGISDFPFIIRNFMKHPEIPVGEKILQTWRHIAGSISWSTASFLLAFAWIPLIFNRGFQDTILAHNLMIYSSGMLRLAWVGLFANIWVYFSLLPPKPDHHSKFRYIGMLLQWALAPVVAILLSSLPAFESQTRLMLGQSLNVFWLTPKVRKGDIQSTPQTKKANP